MLARLFLAAALACGFAACSSTTLDVTAPTTARCQVTVSPATSPTVSSDGIAGSIDVTTTRDCTWSASSSVSWISLTSGQSGQGSGSVAYRVSPNVDPAQRRGAIDVNGVDVSIVQDGAPCRYRVTPTTASAAAAGASVSISIETLAACSWSAASQAPWIAIAGSASGAGNASVSLRVAANGGASRTGTAMIAGQPVTVTQEAPLPPAPTPAPTPTPPPTPTPAPPTPTPTPPAPTPAPSPPTPAPPPAPTCVFSLSPASASTPASGGTAIVAVTAAAGCAWTAVSNASWITVTAGAPGAGNGTVSYTTAPNAGAARTGTITIAGITFTVSQAANDSAACAYHIAPASQAAGAGAGSVAVSVTASQASCTWAASSAAEWLATDPDSGTGSGRITVAWTANGSSNARAGTVTIAGQTFTVTQSAAEPAPCSFTVSPSSQTMAAPGGTGTFAVTASASSCTWSAVSNAAWITVSQTGARSGSGSVSFSVAQNAGPSRTGTISAGGQTFTITQAAAAVCTFTISPSSATVDAGGGTGSINVTASDDTCSWTAASDAAWITITSGESGRGSGIVRYSVARNQGGQRTGNLLVAGNTFTVTQKKPN